MTRDRREGSFFRPYALDLRLVGSGKVLGSRRRQTRDVHGSEGAEQATRVEVSLLGRFVVTVDGVPVPDGAWARRHAATLVKVLALTHGRQLHREQVID